MGIRGKTLGAIAVLIVGMLVALGAALYAAGLQSASQIEQSDVRAALSQARVTIESDQSSLRAVTADWGQWTDTWNFVQGRMPSYTVDDLNDAAVRNLDIDFLVILDNSGRLVAARQLGPRGTFVPLSAGIEDFLAGHPTLLDGSDIRRSKSGLLTTSDGVYDLAAHPITNDQLTAPKAGTIVVGRRLTGARLSQLHALLNYPLALQPVGARGLTTQARLGAAHAASSGFGSAANSDDTVSGYQLMADVNGKLSVLLTVVLPRVARDVTMGTLRRSVEGMVLFAVLMVAVVGAAIEVNVLRRLNYLSRGVTDISVTGPSSRIHIGGSDEVSTVADGINSMLDQLEASHSDLAYLAAHDSLTRLYNRRRFEAELKLALHGDPGSGALLWIDLDHFKDVNDSLGHAAGDELLIQFADLLSSRLRGAETVARLGGDEFGVIMVGAGPDEAVGAANRVLDMLRHQLFAIASREVRMSASIGVAQFPCDGTVVDDLLARADLAMYEAKGRGRNALAVYSSEGALRGAMTDRIVMAEQIVRALRDDRFQLYAQPVRSTSDNSTRTYELLLRMVLEDGTLLMPDQIIPVAERLGLIRDIDRWVVQRGIEMIAQEAEHGRDTSFSVNVSATAFSDPELLEIVRHSIAKHRIRPDRLIIEITETAAIADIERAKAFIQALQGAGCRFSLDDFGAGSSSFYYLKHLPIDYLKIDGGLVRNLDNNTTDKHFVRAIIEMCQGLGIPTIAEFVESDQLYEIVRDLGVDYAQGYGIGHPQPPDIYLANHSDAATVPRAALPVMPDPDAA